MVDSSRSSSDSTSEGVEGVADSNQAVESVAEGSGGDIIRSIGFAGNRKYKVKVLRQRLGLDIGDRLDSFLAESGRSIIAEVYRKIGFAFVKVTLDKGKLSQGKLFYIIDEGPRVQVKKVKFIGNKGIKTKTLRKVVKTKGKKWFYWPFYYTEEAIAEDVKKLGKLYYERGFLDYSVKVERSFTKDNKKANVTFIIEEGPAFRVEKVVLIGNEHFSEEELQAKLKLEEGRVYNKKRADLDVRRLVKLYREQGFIDVRIQQKPKFISEVSAAAVNVEFSIDEGRQFRIGRVDISGNESAQDRVIRRVLDEYGFVPGQLYNADLAPLEPDSKLEKYVQRTVLAEDVIIRPVEPASGAPDQKDVSVDVKEGMTGMIKPGVGISSDSGVIGQLVYEQRNFDITDFPDSLGEFLSMKAFRGAGQTFRVSLMPGTEVSQYSVSFSDPYFRDRPTSFSVSGSKWGRWRESYSEGRMRAYVSLEQRRRDSWNRSVGFRAENVDIHSLDFDAPQEIRNIEGDNGILSVDFGIGRSTIDDLYNPSDGYRFSADYEQATGDHTFGILSGAFSRYFTLYEDVLERKTVLATILRAGTVLGDAPAFERFYGGGLGSYGMRGFEYRGISTKGVQTIVANPERKDPIGADWIFLANAEITVPLIGENFSALFFIDSGTIDTGSYRMSVGIGIQIMVPQVFGPVPMKFELATPLAKDSLDETQVFSFSMGGALF